MAALGGAPSAVAGSHDADPSPPAPAAISSSLVHPSSSPSAAIKSCLTCRVTGTVVFAGVAAYLARERAALPHAARGHRALLAGMSAAAAAAAVARAVIQ